MTEYDPRLVAPTCLYLASKAEESTVQARLLVFYIRKLRKTLFLKIKHNHFSQLSYRFWKSYINNSSHIIFLLADSDDKYRFEIKDILEMEMKILEALNYYLVVYHPYRALSQ